MKESENTNHIKLRFGLPSPSNGFEKFLKGEKNELYADTNSKNRFYYESRVKKIIKLILESNLPHKSKILDLGCASGNISLPLIFHGFDVYSVDIKQNVLGWCNKKAKTNKLKSCSIVANALDLPFKDEVFDCVVATEMIEHLDSPSEGIDEIKRVLKEGGTIVLSTPNRENINFNKAPKYSSVKDTERELENRFLPSELRYELEMPDYAGARHIFEFRESELTQFLEERGLIIDEITKANNKMLSNIGVKLPLDYDKLLKIDEKYSNSLFSKWLYNNLIVRCFKPANRKSTHGHK
ncbi:MAG: class I SAM-dependent methyltransferase [Methanosarcinales archaeon]|nr:MAG: class I SAM-dependent methyltransferase [Methanosarcinales archaeon]